MSFATIINICATCAPDISRRRFFLRRCAAILRCTWREFILRDTGWTRRTMIRRCCRCHGGDELMICSLKDSKNGMIIDVLPVVPWKRVRISNMEMKYDEMTWHCRPFLWKREEIYRNLTLFSLTSAVVVLFMMTLTLLCARQDGWEAGCQMVALNGQKSLLEWKSDPGIRGIPYIKYIYIGLYYI